MYCPYYQLEIHSDSTDDDLLLERDFSNPKTEKTKYKTQLCRNFIQTGCCPYQERCQYAHGYNDFSFKIYSNLKSGYRTKKCKSFWNDGHCTYGKRCQFSHYEEQSIDKQYLALHLFLIEKADDESSSKLLRVLGI